MEDKKELVTWLSQFEDLEDVLSVLKTEYNLYSLVGGDKWIHGNASLTRRFDYEDGLLIPVYALTIDGDTTEFQEYIEAIKLYFFDRTAYEQKYRKDNEINDLISCIEPDDLLDLRELFKKAFM